jgi:hypothetical protein
MIPANEIVIGVIDGQGGGIGSNIIKRIRDEIEQGVELVALGTNAMATYLMMKSKANRGCSGENAICRTVLKLDIIVGALAVVIPNSMMGEITPAIADAVATAPAEKILLPLRIDGLRLAGYTSHPFPHLIDNLIEQLKGKLSIRRGQAGI